MSIRFQRFVQRVIENSKFQETDVPPKTPQKVTPTFPPQSPPKKINGHSQDFRRSSPIKPGIQRSTKMFSFYLEQEALNKKDQLPRFVRLLQGLWDKIPDPEEIAQLLFDNYEVIFRTWLTQIFPFRNAPLQMTNPYKGTAVDFKVDFAYLYSPREIEAIRQAITATGLPDDPKTTAKRLFAFTVASMGFLIVYTVQSPFAFGTGSMHGEPQEGDKFQLQCIISSRQQ